MTTLARGQKTKLADISCSGPFPLVLQVAAAGMEIDIACFGLDANDKLSDDRYMVFFNQTACPSDAVTLSIAADQSTFKINLAGLPSSIQKLVFTASITGAGSMRSIGVSSLRLGDAIFAFSGSDFQDEKAIIVGEIYQRDNQWRFGAVGQGFNGGLSALLTHFGGTEAETAPTNTPAPTPAATQSSVQEPKKVSLSKVTLAKRGDKVSLEKKGNQGFGRIVVNLNWNQSAQPNSTPAAPSFLTKIMGTGGKKSSNGIDLDLGCMFELADGRRGIVQALGDCWGSFDHPPFVQLDSDDRSGNSVNGETIFINGNQLTQVKRLLIFTFIYEGVANWAHTNGVVTITTPNQPPIEVNLDNGTNALMCAIAMIENNNGNLQVTKVVEYFEGNRQKMAHEMMNDRFSFGLNFKPGSKG
jgi:tellurite resistance protein TerA